ncbi:MAG TPA: FAD-binding oxidoreductase, partial [Candidatus Limnocylindria bacterium]|nr:FAD-binding oxidoreductase [Candidatus Limnocylindria bacterium]
VTTLTHAAGSDDRYARIRVVDAVTYEVAEVLPMLPTPRGRLARVALHPTCSSTEMGINDALMTVARAVADEVYVPDSWGCYASCNRTCELGMTRATGQQYHHVLELLDSATAPAGTM